MELSLGRSRVVVAAGRHRKIRRLGERETEQQDSGRLCSTGRLAHILSLLKRLALIKTKSGEIFLSHCRRQVRQSERERARKKVREIESANALHAALLQLQVQQVARSTQRSVAMINCALCWLPTCYIHTPPLQFLPLQYTSAAFYPSSSYASSSQSLQQRK